LALFQVSGSHESLDPFVCRAKIGTVIGLAVADRIVRRTDDNHVGRRTDPQTIDPTAPLGQSRARSEFSDEASEVEIDADFGCLGRN
jgi:hypothetical protein